MLRLRCPVPARLLVAAAAALTSTLIGAPAAQASPRIINGTQTTINAVPWQVSVWSRNGVTGGMECGGVIVGPQTVLTAAHCVEGIAIGASPTSGGLGVMAGRSSLGAELLGDSTQERVVDDLRVHPQWTTDVVRTAGDLAVLTLDEPLVLDGITAKAVALPADLPAEQVPSYVGAPVLVSGFGLQNASLAPNGKLYLLEKTVLAPSFCDAADSATAICASAPQGSACSGDSGGPLVTRTEPPVLIGIVSNGLSGCPVGNGESYVNLAIPENRRFIAGEPNPPVAPRQVADLTLTAAGGLFVDSSLVCSASWNGLPTISWKLTRDDGLIAVNTTGDTAIAYRLTEGDAGHKFTCDASALNAGGRASDSAGTALPVQRRPTTSAPTTKTPSIPLTTLSGATMKVTAASKVKRGKVLRIDVALANLGAAADTSSVCVRLGRAKPRCVQPVVKGQQTAKAVLRVRVSKKARAKSLQTYSVTAALWGSAARSAGVEQVTRTASVRARISR